MCFYIIRAGERAGKARRSEKRVAPVIREEHFFQLIISSGFMLKCTRNGTSYVIIHLRCFLCFLLLLCAAGCIFNKRTELKGPLGAPGRRAFAYLSLLCAFIRLPWLWTHNAMHLLPLLKAKPAAAPSASSRKRHDITSCEVSLYPL